MPRISGRPLPAQAKRISGTAVSRGRCSQGSREPGGERGEGVTRIWPLARGCVPGYRNVRTVCDRRAGVRVGACTHVFLDERTAADLYEDGARQVEDYTQRIAKCRSASHASEGSACPREPGERAWRIRRVMEDLSPLTGNATTNCCAGIAKRECGGRVWPRSAKCSTCLRTTAGGRARLRRCCASHRRRVLPRAAAQEEWGRTILSTPTANDPAALREHSRASVADNRVHEGFPGHDWHYST